MLIVKENGALVRQTVEWAGDFDPGGAGAPVPSSLPGAARAGNRRQLPHFPQFDASVPANLIDDWISRKTCARTSSMGRVDDRAAIRRKAVSWLKEHAGLWTLGLMILAFLGLQGGIGSWALNEREARLTAQDHQLETLVKTEVKRLDGRIDDERFLLGEIKKKIDNLDDDLNRRMDKLDSRIDSLDHELNRRIDQLDSKLNRRIDQLDSKLNSRIDQLDGRMDAILQVLLERLPASSASTRP